MIKRVYRFRTRFADFFFRESLEMPGNTSRSFVVRIWVEPREDPKAPMEWRGMVEDVISEERKYFTKFDDLITFLASALSIDIPRTKGSEQ